MPRGVNEAFGAYLPEDRLRAFQGGEVVDERGVGAVLFADVVGFTGLTSRLAALYGPRRGAEEVPVHLNALYEALVGAVQRHGGSVVGFAGDAITCWFSGDDGRVAVACGLAMQEGMTPFAELSLGGAGKGESIALTLKVAVTAGSVRRFVVGDPEVQLVDVIAGGPVAQIAVLEGLVRPGQVVVSGEVAAALGPSARVAGVAAGSVAGAGPAADARVVTHLFGEVPNRTRPTSPSSSSEPSDLAPWLLPTVKRRLESGQGDFLTELRPVAALFLGFDALDMNDDENAPGKFDAVVRAAQRVATDYGGNVLQVTSGDKGNYLYLAFGAPVSHEDDGKRCASAALELREALRRYDYLKHVSIGVGYGTARTGAYGSAVRRTYGALGEGTNMAARMMSAAPAWQIYVSGALAAATKGAFLLEELRDVRVKGRSEPVEAYSLLGTVGRDPSTSGLDRDRLVGRAEELGILRSNLARAAAGEGRVVQLVADAGMGKSELLRNVLAQAGELRVVRGACQAYGRTAPYQLWRGVFHRLLGLDENSPADERVQQVPARIAALDEALVPQAALLTPVLDLPLDSEVEGMAQGAEERSVARRTLLVNLFRKAARQTARTGRTLTLVLEDLHWLDAASEELWAQIGQAATAVPALVLTTARPAAGVGKPAPGSLQGATLMTLSPLNAEAAAEVAARQFGAAGFADQAGTLVPTVVERSGGNPFYLQELVTHLVQELTRGAAPSALGVELPTSLHSLVLGRLDRLTDREQTSLKVASVVGREFRTGWVSACQPGATEEATEADFQATGSQGLTHQLSWQPAVHEFNHAITHEATYESQTHAGRTRLHTQLARYLEREVATPAEPHLDLLAYHYSLGDDQEKARTYLGAAGAAAKAAYANEAALTYFGQLLELQEGSERLPTLLELGEVGTFVGSYAAAEAYLLEARSVTEQHEGFRAQAGVALRLLGELRERQGDHGAARQLLEDAARTSRQVGDDAELTRVLLALGGNVLWHLGEYETAEAQLEEAVALARAAGAVRSAARALHGAANIYQDRGDTARAEEALQESLAMRRAAHDDYGVANALNNLAVLYANAGQNDRAEELFAESLGIRRRLGDATGVAVALNNLGYMASLRGGMAEARQLYEESLTARRELGDRLGLAVSLCSLGELLAEQGELMAATDAYVESAQLAAAIGNSRELAAALAGLSVVAPANADGARMARTAEALLGRSGTTLDSEAGSRLQKGLARSTTGALPAHLAEAHLEGWLVWALSGESGLTEG